METENFMNYYIQILILRFNVIRILYESESRTNQREYKISFFSNNFLCFLTGGCYQYCRKVECSGNGGYNSDCGFPLRNVDCVDVIHYSKPSCVHNADEINHYGIFYIRPGCKATFKICSGQGW